MSLSGFQHGIITPLLVGPANMPVVPSNGAIYFVDGTLGDDSSEGLTPNTAFKTLDCAYNACVGGLNEIIYVLGNTSSVNFSSAVGVGGLIWSKSFTHLIGLCAPSFLGQRARISNGASTALYTPLITVSGSGCLFQNIEFFNGGNHATAAAVCVAVTGQRNVFVNCQISGGGIVASATNAAMRSLVIGGGTPANADENLFQHCYIGLDTVQRTTASAEVEIKGQSARVTFEDCQFASWTGANTPFFLMLGANAIDRWLMFKNCVFFDSIIGGGTAMAAGFSVNATQNGYVFIKSCLLYGSTAMEASNSGFIIGDNVNGATTTAKGLPITW